jgi:uracil phosphoribosyltransferase
MAQANIINHPILAHLLSQLRDRNTSNFDFSRLLHEVASLMTFEVARDLDLRSSISTQEGKPARITNPPSLIVLMRAGNGMIDGARDVLRDSPVGHIGIYRDKQVGCTVEYFFKIPEGSKENGVILLDPVIGTGDSIIAAVKRLEQLDIASITVVTVLGSEKGVARLIEACPGIRLFALDATDALSDEGALVPGMGDVSARMYNYA